MLTCFKVLLTSATESVITQSSRTAGALMHASVLLALKHSSDIASLLGLCHWAAHQNKFGEILRALLAWETYVYIAIASEIDHKEKLNKQYKFIVNITIPKVPKE